MLLQHALSPPSVIFFLLCLIVPPFYLWICVGRIGGSPTLGGREGVRVLRELMAIL